MIHGRRETIEALMHRALEQLEPALESNEVAVVLVLDDTGCNSAVIADADLPVILPLIARWVSKRLVQLADEVTRPRDGMLS